MASKYGHIAYQEPVLTIKFITPPAGLSVALRQTDGLIFTSANGVRALQSQKPIAVASASLPVWCVGPASARMAAGAGFTKIYKGNGDVQALEKKIKAQINPEKRAKMSLLRIRANHQTGQLTRNLRADGIAVKEITLYHACAIKSLSATTQLLISQNSIDMVCLFSKRSAEIFEHLLDRAGLCGYCRQISALCLSRFVAEQLKLDWRDISIANHPDSQAMLAKLEPAKT